MNSEYSAGNFVTTPNETKRTPSLLRATLLALRVNTKRTPSILRAAPSALRSKQADSEYTPGNSVRTPSAAKRTQGLLRETPLALRETKQTPSILRAAPADRPSLHQQLKNRTCFAIKSHPHCEVTLAMPNAENRSEKPGSTTTLATMVHLAAPPRRRTTRRTAATVRTDMPVSNAAAVWFCEVCSFRPSPKACHT